MGWGKNSKIYGVRSDCFSCLFECVALSYSDLTVGSVNWATCLTLTRIERRLRASQVCRTQSCRLQRRFTFYCILTHLQWPCWQRWVSITALMSRREISSRWLISDGRQAGLCAPDSWLGSGAGSHCGKSNWLGAVQAAFRLSCWRVGGVAVNYYWSAVVGKSFDTAPGQRQLTAISRRIVACCWLGTATSCGSEFTGWSRIA